MKKEIKFGEAGTKAREKAKAENPGMNDTRLNEVARAADEVAAKAKEAQPKKEKTPKEDLVLAKKVHIVVAKNPKRESSASHKRFALYVEGMTGLAYVEASVASGQSRRAARADLKWDVDHKFVELVD